MRDSNKLHRIIFFFLCLLLIASCTKKVNEDEEVNKKLTLVTSNAMSQTKKVYNFLKANYGKNIISGMMAVVSWNTDEADRIYRWTGKYPALNGFDFIHLNHTTPGGWIDYDDISVIEDWWAQNGLVSIMWHWNVPVSKGNSECAFYTNYTSFDITKAVEEGTDENRIIRDDIDKIAGYLLALQAKGIPVIWRPLHEASGGWFWWGAKGPEPCKKLWIMMFEHFKAKGIKNLIWTWTTETNDEEWYPGDAYVDIIGRDLYNRNDLSSISVEFENIGNAHPNKMITLSECGNVAEIPAQWEGGARWSWFMPWYDYVATDVSTHEFATKEFWINAFSFNNVITRDRMPSLK